MNILVKIRPIGSETPLFVTSDPEAAAVYIADNWDIASDIWTYAEINGQFSSKLADDIDLLGADMADIRRMTARS